MGHVFFCILGGLMQRCVIVQRDENGYGLTVSGDNPVFVQSVKDGEYYRFYNANFYQA